jgi:hypothetical protein
MVVLWCTAVVCPCRMCLSKAKQSNLSALAGQSFGGGVVDRDVESDWLSIFRRMIDIVPRLLSSCFASTCIILQGRLMHGMHGMGQSLCLICFMLSIPIDHSSVEVRPFLYDLRMIESSIGFCFKSATGGHKPIDFLGKPKDTSERVTRKK